MLSVILGQLPSFYCSVCNSVPQPISLSIAFGKHENRNTLSLMGFRPAEKAASKTRIMTEKCWLLLHTPARFFIPIKNFYLYFYAIIFVLYIKNTIPHLVELLVVVACRLPIFDTIYICFIFRNKKFFSLFRFTYIIQSYSQIWFGLLHSTLCKMAF